MSRKHRRKIKRRTKERKNKNPRRKNSLIKHLDAPVTNRFTRLTTYMMIIIETLFLIVCAWWAYKEIFVRSIL